MRHVALTEPEPGAQTPPAAGEGAISISDVQFFAVDVPLFKWMPILRPRLWFLHDATCMRDQEGFPPGLHICDRHPMACLPLPYFEAIPPQGYLSREFK